MKRMRVALVALHFAEYAAHLAAALADTHEVLLLLYKDNVENELGQRLQQTVTHPFLRVELLTRPTSAANVLSNAFRLARTLRQFGPELIHYQEELRDEVMLTLPLLKRIPKIVTIHDPLPHSGTDAARLRFSRHRLYRALMRNSCDLAITHGQELVSTLERAHGRLRGRVRSIPHGPLGDRNLQAQHPPSQNLRLLFFGRLHEYKGLRYFIDAVQRLHAEGLPVVGVVAGRGEDLGRHVERMRAAGCFEVLDRFIPSDQVPQLFLTARVVVLPYTDGTQSGVAAMALGFGRPAVASAVGSIPELVRDGENGLLVPARDTDQLTDALRRLCTDDALWRSLSAGAVRLREGELSWQAIAARTTAVYRSLIQDYGTDEMLHAKSKQGAREGAGRATTHINK